MARTLLTAALRGVKALLLVVALGALAAWPWSYGHPGRVEGERPMKAHGRGVSDRVSAGWGEGRVGLSWRTVSLNRQEAALATPGWTWRVVPGRRWWNDYPIARSWGPLRSVEIEEENPLMRFSAYSVPAWLVALAACPWPLAGVVPLIRRRRNARRLRLANCCRRCGYELRGALSFCEGRLVKCPECGTRSTCAPRP